jgi:hypothetical protein
MKDISGFDPLVDDIAILIDTAVADPARADEIKRQIMTRVALRTGLPAQTSDTVTDADDGEDLWDNVPL